MIINATVTANAKVPFIAKIGENNYKIKVNAPATDGKANRRLVEMLAEYFDVSKSRVKITGGATSRNKLIEIG